MKKCEGKQHHACLGKTYKHMRENCFSANPACVYIFLDIDVVYSKDRAS